MEREVFSLDAARSLIDTEEVETALGDQVERLLADGWQDPKPGERRHSVAGRAAFWWRFRLLEWARSRTATKRCGVEPLRGFRRFLTDLTDREVCQLVESVLGRINRVVGTG